jgi:hypothetical protein
VDAPAGRARGGATPSPGVASSTSTPVHGVTPEF